jgi:hypothetical protein
VFATDEFIAKAPVEHVLADVLAKPSCS